MPCDSPCLIASRLPIPASSACRPESCTGNISCLCEYRTCMVAAVLPGLVASPALPPPRPLLANPSAPRRPASIRHLKSMLWGGSRDARRDLQIERNTDHRPHLAYRLRVGVECAAADSSDIRPDLGAHLQIQSSTCLPSRIPRQPQHFSASVFAPPRSTRRVKGYRLRRPRAVGRLGA